MWEESIFHVNGNRLLVPWNSGVLAYNGRFRRLVGFMGSEDDNMKLSKPALERRGKIVLAYDGGVDNPWNHLDPWHMTWSNNRTYFSSLWLFVCFQETIASLEILKHEKGIILSHETFICNQYIKKKGGTFVDFCSHYVLEYSSLFGVRNHVFS